MPVTEDPEAAVAGSSAKPACLLNSLRCVAVAGPAASLHRVDARELFEADLARRGLRHAADPRPSGRGAG